MSEIKEKEQFAIADVSGSFYPANAVCLVCGTTKENTKNAFCINGHDDWLETNDDMERFAIASKRFGVPMDKIVLAIDEGIDLEVVSE